MGRKLEGSQARVHIRVDLGTGGRKIVFLIVFASFIKLNKLCYPNICFGINSIKSFPDSRSLSRVVFAVCD